MNESATVMATNLLRDLTTHLPAAIGRLERLVNLDTSSYAVPALTEASRWIEPQLAALGFRVERHESATTGPVLVGRASGRGRHRVLLLAHYDTVFEPGEPSRRPFRSEGPRAYGPGVADMKGGIVTLWEALWGLQRMGWHGYGALTVIHNADEEISSIASRTLIEAEARDADFCLVLEPGRPHGEIVTARKGIAHFRLTVKGKAAHAGVAPQDGASAVVALARKILAAHALNDYATGLTLNTIVSKGGARSNVVPDEAVADIDVRIPTLVSGEEVIGRLRAIAEADDLPGTRGVLTGGIDRPPFEPTGKSVALLEIARDAARALGFTLRNVVTGGGSDGNFVAALGVPVLDGLGAVGGGYHSPDEYLEVETIPQRAALVAMTLVEACRRDDFLRAP
ncbi:MAG: M20 family metallopeptidase [Armatimonadota bacterium]|nr:M20 family metallopeptidase [Armatimonadota bacterium]